MWLGHQLRSVSGIELTGSGQHFNAFPIERVPFAQSGGAPQWQPDPLASAALLRAAVASASEEGGWVQLNHPLVGEVFSDRDRDGVPDGGYAGLEGLIDAAEFGKEGDVLSLTPMYEEASDLSKGRGRSWESLMKPLAFTNPIHVDVDGAGFVPNGDTLGYPLLTAKRAEIGK